MAGALLYLDANPFIYAVEGDAETSDPVQELFFALRERPGLAATSEMTLAEALAPSTRKGALPVHIKRRLYLDLIVRSRIFTLMPVTGDVLYETVDVRQFQRLKLPDAIHLVSAIHAGCRIFLSRDAGIRMPDGMERLDPDRSGVDQALKVIARP